MAVERWSRTVPRERCGSCAICALSRPRAAASRTSRSRAVSGLAPSARAAAASSGPMTRSFATARRIVPSAHLGGDSDVRFQFQPCGQRLADHRLVLGEQQHDHAVQGTEGTVARRGNPPRSPGEVSNAPSTRASRSRRLSSSSSPPPVPVGPRPSSTTAGADADSPVADADAMGVTVQREASLWRTTLVTASRSVQATAASRAGVSCAWSSRTGSSPTMPAASNAVRIPASSRPGGRRLPERVRWWPRDTRRLRRPYDRACRASGDSDRPAPRVPHAVGGRTAG